MRFNRSGEQEAQRQSDHQFHVPGEMMPVDEWTKGSALRQLAKPVDAGAVRGQGLRQSEHCQQEPKDDYCARQRAEASRRISEDQSCRKID